jgi:hypothetical protein
MQPHPRGADPSDHLPFSLPHRMPASGRGVTKLKGCRTRRRLTFRGEPSRRINFTQTPHRRKSSAGSLRGAPGSGIAGPPGPVGRSAGRQVRKPVRQSPPPGATEESHPWFRPVIKLGHVRPTIDPVYSRRRGGSDPPPADRRRRDTVSIGRHGPPAYHIGPAAVLRQRRLSEAWHLVLICLFKNRPPSLRRKCSRFVL